MADQIDFLRLPGGEILRGVEAPAADYEALAREDLWTPAMQPRNPLAAS